MNRWRGAFTMALVLTVAACGSARMEPPPSLAPAPELAVEGRKRGFAAGDIAFGGYRTRGLDRSWTRGSGGTERSGRAIEGTRSGNRQRYAFVLSENGEDRWSADCSAAASSGGVQVGGWELESSSQAFLECDLTAAAAGERARLLLSAGRGESLEGSVMHADGRLRVTRVRRRRGWLLSDGGTIGYEIRDGERVIAATKVAGAGGVWLRPELDGWNRSLAAVTATALLLYQDLR